MADDGWHAPILRPLEPPQQAPCAALSLQFSVLTNSRWVQRPQAA